MRSCVLWFVWFFFPFFSFVFILKFGANHFQLANQKPRLILLNTFSGSNVQTLRQHLPRSLQQKGEQRRHSRDVKTTIKQSSKSMH